MSDKAQDKNKAETTYVSSNHSLSSNQQDINPNNINVNVGSGILNTLNTHDKHHSGLVELKIKGLEHTNVLGGIFVIFTNQL